MKERVLSFLDVLGLAGLILWVLSPLANAIFGIHLHATDVRRASVAVIALAVGLRIKGQGSVSKGLWGVIWTKFTRISWQRVLFASFFFLACLIVVVWTYAFRFTLFDVGLFHQVFWSLSHGHGFLSTISGSGDHIKDHFSPSFAALAPLFYLTGGAPWFLPLLQVLLTAVGLGAWFCLARRVFPKDDRTDANCRLTIFIAALSMNSLWGNLAWGFHETVLAFAGFSWAYALILMPVGKNGKTCLDRYRIPLGCVAFLFAALSKETALLDAAVFTLIYGMLLVRRYPLRSALLILAGVMFAALFVWFEVQPKPADKNYLVRYYGYLGTNLKDFSLNLLLHPMRVIEVIGVREVGRFAWTLLAPFIGLPLLFVFLWCRRKGDPRRSPSPLLRALRFVALRRAGDDGLGIGVVILVSVLPNLLTMAISTLVDLRMDRFHYVMAVWPAFAVISILALKSLVQRWPSTRIRALLLLWIFVSQMLWERDPIGLLHLGVRDLFSAWQSERAFNAIGPADSVVADERVGPWLSNREMITRWPDLTLFGDKCPDWIVLYKDHSADLMQHACGSVALVVNNEDAGLWSLYRVSPEAQKKQ